MIFVFGAITILLISFVVAFLSMVREHRKLAKRQVLAEKPAEEAAEISQADQPKKVDAVANLQSAVQNAQAAEDQTNQAPTASTEEVQVKEPFPWEVKKEDSLQGSTELKQETLHPKGTTTIGSGLRQNLNDSVSMDDLKKQD